MTSTSVVILGRPQISAACAPNTYQARPRFRSTRDKSASSSAGPEGDGTKGLRHTRVDGQIVVSVGLTGPIGPKGLHVEPKLVARREDCRRRHIVFAMEPRVCLGFGNARPIASGKGNDGLSIHVFIIAPAQTLADYAYEERLS